MIKSRVSYFFLFVSLIFAFTGAFRECALSEGIHPQINKNTPDITGCKRPKLWGMMTNGDYDMIVMDYILQKTSKKSVVLFKNKKHGRNIAIVVAGEWKVKDLDGKEIIVKDPKKLHIDHILPWKYLSLNMKNCKPQTINKYYNYIDNLTPELAEVNKKKSDLLCETKEQCERQIKICDKIAKDFDDKNLCENIKATSDVYNL